MNINIYNRAKPLPDQEFLMECLNYNPESGKFYWQTRPVSHFTDGIRNSAEVKCKRWNTLWAGKEAGYLRKDGYVYIKIDGKNYMAHRLAFKMYYGRDPYPTVNHKCMTFAGKSDNRIANLEEACMLEQAYDRVNNNDLPRGVCFDRRLKTNPYRALVLGEYLGRYPTLEEAADVAECAYQYWESLQKLG